MQSAYYTSVEVSGALSSSTPAATTHDLAPVNFSSTSLSPNTVQQMIIYALSVLGISSKPTSSPSSWLID